LTVRADSDLALQNDLRSVRVGDFFIGHRSLTSPWQNPLHLKTMFQPFERIFLIGTVVVVVGILVVLAKIQGATPQSVIDSIWQMRFAILIFGPIVLFGILYEIRKLNK
jgi:hypothetical protein